jgi:hypothetical protein
MLSAAVVAFFSNSKFSLSEASYPAQKMLFYLLYYKRRRAALYLGLYFSSRQYPLAVLYSLYDYDAVYANSSYYTLYSIHSEAQGILYAIYTLLFTSLYLATL